MEPVFHKCVKPAPNPVFHKIELFEQMDVLGGGAITGNFTKIVSVHLNPKASLAETQ